MRDSRWGSRDAARWRAACGRVLLVGLAALASAGSQGADQSADQGSKVERCGRSFGTLSVVDPQTGWNHIQQFGLGSPSALVRMMVQQSGCFDVVERGVALRNLDYERGIASSGQARADSNIGQGQMQVADFVMTPDVQIPTATTGGVGAGLAGLLGRLGPLGAIAGGLKFKEASTSLLIADVRSSLQVAAAQGKASQTDFSIGGWALGGGGAAALGGFASSPEGKVVAASLLDNYNQIVLAIRDKPTLIKASSEVADANAKASTRAQAPQVPGQMLQAKLANVKVYSEPSRDAPVVTTLQRSDELVATGEVRDGFLQVDAANFSGWVQRTLVGPAGAIAAAPVQPARLAPVAPPPPSAGTGFGYFLGSFSGADSGNFQISINGQGVVSGSGMSASGASFGINGRLDPGGQLALFANGAAGTALFAGRVDPGSGQVSGTWRYAARDAGGAFSGQRQ